MEKKCTMLEFSNMVSQTWKGTGCSGKRTSGDDGQKTGIILCLNVTLNPADGGISWIIETFVRFLAVCVSRIGPMHTQQPGS